MPEVERHAGLVLRVAGDTGAEADRVRAEPLERDLVEQHLEGAAVHEALLVQVAHVHAALLGVDLLAEVVVEDRVLRVDGDRTELLEQAEVVDLGRADGLDVDADAERPELGHDLVDDRAEALLVQAERGEQAAGPGADDRDVEIGGGHVVVLVVGGEGWVGGQEAGAESSARKPVVAAQARAALRAL